MFLRSKIRVNFCCQFFVQNTWMLFFGGMFPLPSHILSLANCKLSSSESLTVRRFLEPLMDLPAKTANRFVGDLKGPDFFQESQNKSEPTAGFHHKKSNSEFFRRWRDY